MKYALILNRVHPSDWQIIKSIEGSVPQSPIFKAFIDQKDIENYINDSFVYLVNRENQLVGSISYQIKPDKSAYIDGLITLPEFQGQGIASNALGIILSQLKDAPKIWLHTHPHNTASLITYLKKGFVITSWVDNLFGDSQPRLILEKIHN